MAQISTYASIQTPTLDDKLIGTDVENENLTKNFTVSSILSLQNIDLTNVLSATSYADQEPSGLDSPLQVTFGAAQNTASDAVMLDSAGNITFNQTGTYLFNGYATIERQGSSGGVASLLFRSLINGSQASTIKGFDLGNTQIMIPYEVTVPVKIETSGTILTWELLRDSSGVDSGGIYSHTTSSSWDNVPSTHFDIYKLG